MTEIVEPDQVAPAIVDAVGRALNAPYVAIHLDGELTASIGTSTAELESVDLTYQGSQLGRLEIAGPLDRLDRRLIADLADHCGAALSAARESARTRRLAADLQRAGRSWSPPGRRSAAGSAATCTTPSVRHSAARR
ncbi:hypothetical protein [Dactylosporangium cerinum]